MHLHLRLILLLTLLTAGWSSVNAQSLRGEASYYADKFHGRPTSTGERYNKNELTCASRDLPAGSILRVARVDNGRSVVVRVNDCGPFSGNRILDLSRAAAKEIGLLRDGVTEVDIEIMEMGTQGATCYRSRQPRPANKPVTAKPAEPVVASRPTPPTPPAPANPTPRPAEVPSPTIPSADPAPVAVSTFGVQAGSFREETNARRRVQELIDQGYSNLILAERNGLIRVIVGPYADRDTADQHLRTLLQKRMEGVVVGL